MLAYWERRTEIDSDFLYHLREKLQIIENGFSVDYKNKIQILILSVEMNTDLESLPSYEEYIRERISQYTQDYPDIYLRKLYLGFISLEDLKWFNTQVKVINDLISNKASENDIIHTCKILMSTYLDGDPKIVIKATTLEELEAVLGDS